MAQSTTIQLLQCDKCCTRIEHKYKQPKQFLIIKRALQSMQMLSEPVCYKKAQIFKAPYVILHTSSHLPH